jgi:hypothetical protein
MSYRRIEADQLHISAISDEIGERLRFLAGTKPLLQSHRLLLLIQRLAKADG